MNAKKIMFSFAAIVCALFLVANVCAADAVAIEKVKVDQNVVSAYNEDVVLVAGETALIKVYYNATGVNASCDENLEITAEFEDGDSVSTLIQNVIKGERDYVILKLDVPFVDDLDDMRIANLTLNVDLDGDNTNLYQDYVVRVRRPSYDAQIDVIMDSTVTAGQTLVVDVVIENIGFNDLEDAYITVSIPALDVTKKAPLDDVVAIECMSDCYDDACYNSSEFCTCNDDCDDEDTSIKAKVYLTIPYEAEAGQYALEVQVSNDDTTLNEVASLNVKNNFANNVIVESARQNAAVGEDAEYSLLLVNPTNQVKVYRVITESSDDLTASVSELMVAVPAGSSKTVIVTANADSEGEYSFNVNIFSGETVEVATLSLNAEGSKSFATNPIVVLIIILVIVFIVLLVVLIVLLGRKPEQSEEFGESYY